MKGRLMSRAIAATATALCALFFSTEFSSTYRADSGGGTNPLAKIRYIVVIYQENHSFDNLYGGWEGVNGRANAGPAHTIQVGQGGAAYTCLLQNDLSLTSPP